jgi:hypothetical protein
MFEGQWIFGIRSFVTNISNIRESSFHVLQGVNPEKSIGLNQTKGRSLIP